MSPIFVDTSAWCAFFNAGDQHHDWAKNAWQELGTQHGELVTSDYVLDETITLLRNRCGFAAAKEAGEKLQASEILTRLFVDQRHFQLAWEWFKKYRDHDFSFTDCSSFVFMKEKRIERVWTLDQHFVAAGFEKI